MEKRQVVLEVPAIEASYEVMIPTGITVAELGRLLGKSVEDLTMGRYRTSGAEILCSRDRGCALGSDVTVGAYDVQNGERLVLM